MGISKSKVKKVIEQLIQHPQTIWHKVLVYIFYNTKHEERRKRIEKHNDAHLRVQFARTNHY